MLIPTHKQASDYTKKMVPNAEIHWIDDVPGDGIVDVTFFIALGCFRMSTWIEPNGEIYGEW